MTLPACTTAREAHTPLAGTLAEADALNEWCEIRHGVPPGRAAAWTSAEALLTGPDGFTGWRATLAAWLRENYGDAPDRTTAGYVTSWYLSAVGMLGGTPFHLARRVPSLRPEDVAVRIGAEGRPHVVGVALLAEQFACLPDDPDRDHPAATVVADEEALAALLRARFAAHAARFVTTFGPTARLGRRQLWAAATDALDSAAWTAGQLRGDEAAGAADAALLLPAPPRPTLTAVTAPLTGTPTPALAPFTSASTLRCTETGWTRRRESCCFHFALPNAEVCATCPRLR